MKNRILILSTFIAGISSTFGTVSLNFNDAFVSGVPQGLSNAAGVATNGLVWGVLIDGAGNGLTKNYDFTTIAAGSNYILSSGSIATDDILWTSSSLTVNTIASTEGGGVITGGIGGFDDVTGIKLENGVSTGDKFYVVWFSNGIGGILSDTTFVIPAESSSIDYGAPFVGVDPNRLVGRSYTGTSGVSDGTGITFSPVPEPSALILGALSGLALLRRRRN
jgi:hypothetical protein